MAQLYRAQRNSLAPNLPDLPSFGLADDQADKKVSLVLRALRDSAAENRAPTARPFYSIRAVARHFALPTTTVVRLFEQLKTEGLLSSIWGSGTLIEPSQLDAGISLKATVGLPVRLDRFAQCRDYRDVITALEETLWQQGFGVRTVFYRDSTDLFGTIETLCSYRVNRVIWFASSPPAVHAAIRLRDHAIECTFIHGEPPINGDKGYFISNRRALADGLGAWKRMGISTVIIFDTDATISAPLAHRCRTTAKAAGMRVATIDDETTKEQTGIIFGSVEAYSEEATRRSYKARRAMYVEGVPDRLRNKLPGIVTDVIELDSRKIARRIGGDFAAGLRSTDRGQTIFESRWCTGGAAAQ